ncbi:hypothetical protein [Polynucleobacter sp. MWH-UH23A]|uniref:hypothetical protein n=1 Tax=Polynucleobacter sp. MWH-UH23A TaxID=1855613 RepID=UPI003364C320
MFIQTVIQTLLKKRKKAERSSKPTVTTNPRAENELSPMAQSIMQKLAEHEKNAATSPKKDVIAEDKGSK